MKPFVETLPSYIQDNEHFLQLLESLSSLSENVIMVTPNGATFYMNIPHEGGIESVLQYMKLIAKTVPPGTQHRHTIDILLETILKNSTFLFMGRHFLQQADTAIGTKSNHSYVNHFMRNHEKSIQECFI